MSYECGKSRNACIQGNRYLACLLSLPDQVASNSKKAVGQSALGLGYSPRKSLPVFSPFDIRRDARLF
jgi:hypothetical protein